MTPPSTAGQDPSKSSTPRAHSAALKPDAKLFARAKPRAPKTPPLQRTPPPDGIVGPLKSAIAVDALSTSTKLDAANALSILRRCAVVKDGVLDDGPIRAWAVRTGLGQNRDLLDAVRERRTAAVTSLKRTAVQARIVDLHCDGPVLTGVGEAGLRDVGIAMHGTFGWPILPASTLKGVAHAYARDEEGMPANDRVDVFGGPRPDAAIEQVGSVTFLDALPLDVVLAEHVLTPHLREYYEDAEVGEDGNQIEVRKGVPPAEYFNPVPVPFLAVDQGRFTVLLLGPPHHVATAERLLKAAVEQIGLGAKTAVGYGYLYESGKGQIL